MESPGRQRVRPGAQAGERLAVARKSLEVLGDGVRRAESDADEVDRLVAFGRALSDPIRVRMLGMLAGGRGCCDLPDCGVPAEGQDAGICVCEFERFFAMAQSKVSYHLGKLKEAGLVREEKRGRWSFYSLDREATRSLLAGAEDHLGSMPATREYGKAGRVG